MSQTREGVYIGNCSQAFKNTHEHIRMKSMGGGGQNNPPVFCS